MVGACRADLVPPKLRVIQRSEGGHKAATNCCEDVRAMTRPVALRGDTGDCLGRFGLF